MEFLELKLSTCPQLTVVQKPNGTFNLRDFHHAVRSIPSPTLAKMKMDGFQYCKQVSCLSMLLKGEDGLLSCSTQDAVKKIIMISSRFMETVATFKQALLEAADHFVTIEFIEIEQPEYNGSIPKQIHVEEPGLEANHEFAIRVSDFENCTLYRVPFGWSSIIPFSIAKLDPWTLMRLTKRWQQDVASSSEGPIEAVLLFPIVLSAATNKVFCALQPAIMELADVFKPCKVCTCHGQPTEPQVKATATWKDAGVCTVTGQTLGIQSLSENGLIVGSDLFLSMPSFKNSVAVPNSSVDQKIAVAFDIIKCISLATLSEGLVFGLPFTVSPSSEIDIGADGDNVELNEQIFAAVMKELHSSDCGLLCTSTTNLETGEEASFLCFYILLPGQSGSFLVKRLAGAEEIMVASGSGLEVPDDIKCSVSTALSKLGTETYNPLQHLRGCHSKLTSLVKESLRATRPTVSTEQLAVLPQGQVWHQLQEELPISDNSQSRSIDVRSNFRSQSATLPFTCPQQISSRGRATAYRGRTPKGYALRQVAGKGRSSPRLDLAKRYPPASKLSMSQDPFSFSCESTQKTKLPLLPSAKYPDFTTASQHLKSNCR